MTRAIQRALDTLSEGRTTITITHRLSTIGDADKIIVMDRGRIVEQGSHLELMALSGRYAAMVGSSRSGRGPGRGAGAPPHRPPGALTD